MWQLFTNIFKGFDVKDAMNKTDEWALTKEETVRYQLEWLRAMPTGFQLAQRLIGVAFSAVFLVMVITTFTMLAFGHNIDKMVEFIAASMAQPLMIIFSLFFGGGLINSFKNGGRGWAQEVQVNQSKREPAKTIFTNPAPIKELSRREKRQIRRQERKNK